MSFLSTQGLNATYNDITVDEIIVDGQTGQSALQTLTVTGTTQLNGEVFIGNSNLFCAYNSNQVFPYPSGVSDYAGFCGAISGNLNSTSEVDLINVHENGSVDLATNPSFCFYQVPASLPMVTIFGEGNIECMSIQTTNVTAPTNSTQIGYVSSAILQQQITVLGNSSAGILTNNTQQVLQLTNVPIGTYILTGNVQLSLGLNVQLNNSTWTMYNENVAGIVGFDTNFGNAPVNYGNFTNALNIPINTSFFLTVAGNVTLEVNNQFETSLSNSTPDIGIVPFATYFNLTRIA